jgi:hypothetical protein
MSLFVITEEELKQGAFDTCYCCSCSFFVIMLAVGILYLVLAFVPLVK